MLKNLFVLLICAHFSLSAETTLAVKGKTDYVIVIPSVPSTVEKYAASELARYLKTITGAPFKVTSTPGKYNIFIGQEAAKVKLTSLPDLGFEGYVIAERYPDIFISGKTPDSRGTLYGVFSFLERLGCRFWSEISEDVPAESTLVFKGGDDIIDIPAFPLMRLVLSSSSNWQWHMNGKMRQNGISFGVKREPYAGRITEIAPWNSHTFTFFLSSKKYGTSHPEYFALRNGTRVADDATSQLCLTNEEMCAEFIGNIRKYLKKNYRPGMIICIGANDNGNSCQCEKCLAVDSEEGSPSGALLRFVNKIAAAFKDEYPELIFSMDAYWHTVRAPGKTKALPNVFINVANSGIDFSHGHENRKENIEFLTNLKKWSEHADGLNIIDYGANYCQYFFPLPNMEALALKYRDYRKCNVKGIYVINDVGYPRPLGEFADLRTWVTGRLMWNPEIDPWKLVKEFCDGYYGPAGQFLYEYLRWYHAFFLKRHDATFFMNKPPVKLILSKEFVETGKQYFQKAFEAVNYSRKYTLRVKRTYTAIQYQELSLHISEIANSPELTGKLDSFETACSQFGIQARGENLKLSDFIESCRLHPERPPFCKNASTNDCIFLPVDYWSNPAWTKTVTDTLSAKPSKKVIQLFTSNTAWSVFKRTNNLYAIDNDDLWDAWVYARVKPGKKANRDTVAFHGGFWESKINHHVTPVKLSETSQTEYRYFKIASNFSVGLTSLVYIAPMNNPDEVDSIFADYIVFVKSPNKKGE